MFLPDRILMGTQTDLRLWQTNWRSPLLPDSYVSIPRRGITTSLWEQSSMAAQKVSPHDTAEIRRTREHVDRTVTLRSKAFQKIINHFLVCELAISPYSFICSNVRIQGSHNPSLRYVGHPWKLPTPWSNYFPFAPSSHSVVNMESDWGTIIRHCIGGEGSERMFNSRIPNKRQNVPRILARMIAPISHLK